MRPPPREEGRIISKLCWHGPECLIWIWIWIIVASSRTLSQRRVVALHGIAESRYLKVDTVSDWATNEGREFHSATVLCTKDFWPTQYTPAPCKCWLEQPPRAFSLEVTAHVVDAGHWTPSVTVYTKFVVRIGLPYRRYRWLSVTALSGLVTFDLSTSKWGHESPVSWASFLPNFRFLCTSVLDLGSGKCVMPHPMGAGACIMSLLRMSGLDLLTQPKDYRPTPRGSGETSMLTSPLFRV